MSSRATWAMYGEAAAAQSSSSPSLTALLSPWKAPKSFAKADALATGDAALDWDALAADDDIELWLIRVPNDVRVRLTSSGACAFDRRSPALPLLRCSLD